METVIDRIKRLGKQNAIPVAGPMPQAPSPPSEVVAGTTQFDEREQAIIDRHTSNAPGVSFLKKAAKGLAKQEIETRKQQRAYAEKPPTPLAQMTVDLAKEMVANLGDRAKVLDTMRKMSPEQREEALKLVPGIAQQLGDDRGGVVGRTLGAVSRGISHGVSQPIQELVGLGGTPDEIEYIRQLDAAASQEFSPARPGDPWYQSGPLQAAEMVPWMATVVGGAGIGRAGASALAGRVAARGAAGGKIAGAVTKAGQAVGNAPKIAGLPALTAGKAGELAGTAYAAFPGQYAQEVDQLKSLGMQDNTTMRLLAGGTATVSGLIEGIVPNPFKTGPVPLTEGAVKAARQYLFNAAKQAPGEMTEEYLQGVTSGLGEHVAQYLDANAEEKSFGDAFRKGWDQAKEAALPMAFLLGVPAVRGAGLAASRARLNQLKQVREKGYVAEKEANELGIGGKNRPERLANLDANIQQLETEVAAEDGAAVLPPGASEMRDKLKASLPPTRTKPLEVDVTGNEGKIQGGKTPWWDFGTGEPEGAVPPPPGLGLVDRLRGRSAQGTPSAVPPTASLQERMDAIVTEGKAARQRGENTDALKAEFYRLQAELNKTQPATPPALPGTPPQLPPGTPPGLPGPSQAVPSPVPGSVQVDDAMRWRNSQGKTPAKAVLRDGSTIWMNNLSSDIGGMYLDADANEIDPRIINEWQDSKGNTLWKRPQQTPTSPLTPPLPQGAPSASQVPTNEGSNDVQGDAGQGSQVQGQVEGVQPQSQESAAEVQVAGERPSVDDVIAGMNSSVTKSTGHAINVVDSDATGVSPVDIADPVRRQFLGGRSVVLSTNREQIQKRLDSASDPKAWASLAADEEGRHASQHLESDFLDSAASKLEKLPPRVKQAARVLYENDAAFDPAAPKLRDELLYAEIDRIRQQINELGTFTEEALFGKDDAFVKRMRTELEKAGLTSAPKAQAETPQVTPSPQQTEATTAPTEQAAPDARQDFINRAREGAEFTIKGYETSGPYKVMGDGRIFDTKSKRFMGNVESQAKQVKPGDITWTKEVAGEQQQSQPAVEQPPKDETQSPSKPEALSEGFRSLPAKGQAAFETEWTKGGTSIKNILYPDNKNYRAEFEARTGIKLPKTVGGTFQAVEDWHNAGRPLKPITATTQQPESKWSSETRAKLEAVPALKGAKVEADEKAGTVKVTRPDGLATTIQFNADEELAAAAKERWRKPESIHGWYIRKPGETQGRILVHSQANHTNILNHEVMHWLEDTGVVTKEEVEQYGGREEIANKYGKWAELKQRKKDSVFQRIYDALEPVFSSQARFFEEVGARKKLPAEMTEEEKDAEVDKLFKPKAEPPKTIDQLRKLKFDDVSDSEQTEGVGKNKGVTYRRKTYEVTNEDGKQHRYKVTINDRDNALKIEDAGRTKEQEAADYKAEYESLSDSTKQRMKDIGLDDLSDYQKYDVGLFIEGRTDGSRGGERSVNVILGGQSRMRKVMDAMGVKHDSNLTWKDVYEFLRKPQENLSQDKKPSTEPKVSPIGDKIPAEDEFTAAVNAAFDERFGDKAAEDAEPTTKAPKKRSVRKDQKAPPEKKTLTEKAASRKERTSAAKAEKLAKFKELLKQKNIIKAAYDPKAEAKADVELLAATVELTAAAIDDGVSTFAEYVAWIADNIGAVATRKIAPYLEAGWTRLSTYDRFRGRIDKAGKVADVLTEVSDENDIGSTRDIGGTTGTRTEDLETGETEVSEVTDTGRPENSGDGGGRGLAGDGGRTEVEGAEPSGSTERGDEDVRLPSGPGGNYRIGADERVGSGAGRGFSAKARFAENVKAIRLLKKLEKEGRKATAEEQAVLVKYVGWGGLKQAFGRGALSGRKTVYQPIKGYESEFTELKDLLTDEEWQSAKKSITNAHYTDPAVIRGMWQGLEALGFKGGKIVEPSSGTGLFFGLIPQSILDNPSTRLAATEIDSVSGRIAQQLYQGADIRVHGFEELNLADNSVDLFISNVPFGQNQLSDKKDRSIKAAPIHNFFFSKAIRKTRPGGLVAFITSRYSMDEKDASTREFWDKNGADLVGVVRLPGGAFKGIANTDVVTDIIILQKREEGAEPAHAAPWKKRKNVPQTGYLELVPRKDGPGKIKVRNEGDTAFPVNEYFEANPEHVVGELAWTGTMQKTTENQVNVEPPETGTIGDRVSEIIGALPVNKEKLDGVAAMTEELDNADMEAIKSGDWKEDHLRVEGDRIYLNHFGTRVEVPTPYGRHKKGKDGEIVEIVPNKKGAERITAIIKVFDAAERLIALQPTDATDKQIEAARQKLNKVYDAAVKEFGPLSSGWNATFARTSLSVASRVFSLEEYDPTTDTAKKAAIFTERTERPYTFATKADNAQDALTISLSQVGRLDPSHAANLLGKPVDTTMEELGDLVFRNNSGEWELAQTYLSGNVRQKLAEAMELAKDNDDYLRNVEALEAVQPADLTPSQIEVRLGSPWIPTEVYEQFLTHLLRRTVQVSHSQASGKWFLTPDSRNRNDQLETLDWGIARMPALDIITKSLNRGDMRVWEPDGHGGRVVNRDDTTQVAAKLTKIKAEFERWLWSDPERVDLLTGIYNREINNIHQEPRDGSHLTFPGMSEDVRSKLDAHQVNAVWRYLTGGNMLLAHVVGAGKSWVMAAAAMEQKRISGNPSYKTMIAVPNHLVTSGQFVKEILEAYPSAKILAATPDSLSGIGRRSLLKKMATGNYDIVVIAHSSFGKIPLNPTHEADFIQKQIDDLETEVRTARADSDRSYEAELQTMIDNLRDKLANMSAALQRDELSTYFDELNIDSLFVDEAHEFKNLAFRTRMSRVPGVNPTGSNMAFDMWMKTTYFNQATNEKNLMFATGTPIANAIAEMYTMQRYLQPSELARLGLEHFDSWAASFADEVTKPEIDPAGGGMRMHSRLSQYINMPELSAIFRQIADVQTADMLVDVLKRPLIEGDAPQAVKAERNAILEEIIEGLQERAQRVRGGMVDKSEDNMLNIVTDGRKAATDIRLIDPSYPDLKGSKVNLAVENIHRIWEETSDKKSTQVVWLDVTSPNTDYSFNLYHEIVDKLAALGIPRDEIAIMHDYNEKTKAQLFRSMNKGDVRILLGSTAVMGTGVNVQRKLIASHHLDVPWRPDQLEQRDGRILRRGNTNKRVNIIRYISKGSFDSFMWDKIEQKSSFIRAAMSGASDRVLDASEAEDMSAAEMKAAAADDPNLIRFVTVQAEVNKLESEHRGFLDQQSQIRRGIATAHSNVERYTQRAAGFEAMVRVQESLDIPEGEVRGKVGDVEFTDPKEFGEALTKAIVNAPKKHQQRSDAVRFEYNGFTGVVSQPLKLYGSDFSADGWFGATDTNITLELGDSPKGNLARLNNAIAKIKEQPKYYRDETERNRLKIPSLEKRIQAGWPDADKLSELRQEHATLAALVQSSGSDEHKQEIAKRIEDRTGRKVIISGETGRYLWEDVAVIDDSSQNAAQNEASAVVPPNIVDIAEGELTAERNRNREARLRKLREEAEVYEWDRSISPRPAKKKPTRKKATDSGDGSSSLDEFTSPELQKRQSMGAARVPIASAADLVGDDAGGSDSQYASPDKEFERRWGLATKGIGKKTLATKLREFWSELVKSTVRGSLPELPRTEQFGEARSAMHAYQNAPAYAQLAAADLLKKTSKPLSASDYDLFTRIVIMRDQAEAADKGERLSYGLTPAKVKAELDRVEALAENNERVQASLEYRKQWTEAMVDDFLSAHEYLGLDMSDKFKRENYFRHQVLYYMEAQQLGLGKKKVELTPNRGWLKGRTSGDDLGEAFDINANYLQAEWEVSTQMIADTKRAQAIGRIKRHYDKMRQLKAQAKQNNYVAVVGGQENMDEIVDLRGKIAELRATGSLDSGEKAQLKEWSERLWELDPTMPFRRDMAIARDRIERGADDLGEDVPDDFMRYVASLAKQDDSPLQGPALAFLKAISDRKAFIKSELGDKYETWEDVVPDDHEEVAIRPGRAMFQAYSVPEQIASELMAGLSKTLGISAEDLRPLTALGSKYTPLVVPQEVAAQMAAIDNKMDFGWLDHMVTRPMSAWKRWTLMGPTRVLKYNLRNLSEIDKVMSLNPAAIKDIPKAIRDLWKLYSGADDIPATVRDWVERGGSGTLVRVNELGELNELKQFARLIADKKSGVVGKVIKSPVNAWKTYWSTVGIGSDFRESILRYAAYLNYVKQLNAGKLTNYGGSVRAEVDGIKDNKDKAMRLSADLLGDYGDISLAGQFLRSRVAPFWSFQETNVRTYFRGLINLASNEQSAIKAGMQVARAAGIGALVKTPFLAYKLGRIAILFYGLKAMTTAFNQLLFGDDDDELPEEEKRKAHLTFGKNSKGEVQYFSRIGTAADVLDWVGLDSVDYDLRDVLDGRRTLRDVLNDMARSPVDKAYGMLSPFIKAPTELAVGQTAYPSVGKPRPIRDRGRYIAQNLGIQKEYDKLAGNPSTPYSVTDLFLYKVEPGTSAYYLTLDAKSRWLKEDRNRGVGYSDSVRGNALRNYKMAMRLNDQAAVDKYLAEYEAAEGTKKGMLDSLESSHPAGGLSTIDAYLFYKSLAPVEQEEYRDAERFYYSELLTEEQAKTIRARREKRLKDLAFGENKDGTPKGKPEKQSDETFEKYRERKRIWEDERKVAKEALKTFSKPSE